MDFKLLEDDIVSLLRLNVAAYIDGNIDIRPMPQNEDEYDATIEKPQIIVAFDEAHYLETESVGPVVQRENIKLCITLTAFSTRDTLGIFDLRNMIAKYVLGYTPVDCDVPCAFKYFGPPKNDPAFVENFWIYELHVYTRSVITQEELKPEQVITESYKNTTINTTTQQAHPVQQPLIKLTEY